MVPNSRLRGGGKIESQDTEAGGPDFAALAQQYAMTASRTGLVSKRQLQETD